MTWALARVGDVATLINGFAFDSEAFHEVGDVPLVRIRDILGREFATFLTQEEADAGVYVEPGDVVIGMDGDFNCRLWTRPKAALNQRVCALRPSKRVDARFLAYQMPALLRYINDNTYSTTVKHLSSGQVRALKFASPALETQILVADYLDGETARIDELISQQEDLVAAMALRRDAAVRVAVWAKASWRRVRNKNVLFETQDLSPSGNEELLSVSHITGVGVRADMNVNMIEALSTIGYKVVRPDDLVINTLWGWMGALGVSQMRGIVSPAYGTYRAIDPSSVDMRFFGYLYRSSAYVGLIGANSRGVWSSRLRIYPETFLAMSVDVPPLAEQTKIADELDAVTTHFDLLSQECRELIALLKERRAALITAAVTGQIDVRGEVDTPGAEPTDRINSAR